MGELIKLGTTVGNSLVERVAKDVDTFDEVILGNHGVDSLEVPAPHSCDWLLEFGICLELPLVGTVVHVEQVKDCAVR